MAQLRRQVEEGSSPATLFLPHLRMELERQLRDADRDLLRAQYELKMLTNMATKAANTLLLQRLQPKIIQKTQHEQACAERVHLIKERLVEL